MPESQLVHLIIGVVVLLGVTYATLRAAGVRLGRGPLVAIVRGSLQLGAVGLVPRGVLTDPPTVVLALAVMLATASATTGGRPKDLDGARRAAVISCTSGAAVALGVLDLSGRVSVGLGREP